MIIRHVSFAALFLFACSSAPPATYARPTIDPNAEPAEPVTAKPGDTPALDTEYYLGTKEEERAQFEAFARQIQDLQREAASDHGQPIQRGFHAKSHACLEGELRLDPRRDPRTRFGIFADGQPTRRVTARFSNGVGWKQTDNELDARGLALKVHGVPGPKYVADDGDTQDFLMTNTPTPVGRDAVEFMTFARANVKGRLSGIFFLAGHASTTAKALALTNPVDSMVTERFWSGGAYHLGAHQAIKYMTRPCDLRMVREPSRSSEDYLREDLVAAAKQGVCMTLYVQIQNDPIKQPIEDSSVVWEEADAPILPVAKVVMPPQEVAPNGAAACDALAYSPWHAIPAHKPMGHINRARRYVYAASQALRHAGR